MSENIDKIIYINLEKREDKKAYIENQLNSYSFEHWNYAIDTCWRDLQKKDLWYGFNPSISRHAGIFESDCTDGF